MDPFKSFRGLPPAFYRLLLGTFINRLGGFVVPFLALYVTSARHVSIRDAGIIVALVGVGGFLAGPAGGILADRVGRRFTIGLSSVMGATSMVVLGMARSTTELMAGALALGCFGDMYKPASSAMVADLVPAADRTRAYGLNYWAVNLGLSIATMMAGALAAQSFEVLFFADAATTLLFGVFVVATVKETRSRAPRIEKAKPNLVAPYRDRRFLLFCCLVALLVLVYGQVQVTLPIDLRAHGVTPRAYGVLLAINTLLVVVVQPFASGLVGRVPRAIALAGSVALVGVGFGMTGIAAGSLPLYALSIIVWSLGEIAFEPLKPAVIADLAPPDLRGSYQGAYQMAYGGASFLGPVLGSAILGACGGTALWSICALVAFVAAAFFAFTDVRQQVKNTQ